MATAPLSNLTATWNASGTTFTAIKMDVTDTASAAGSLLMDLQVGGSSRFLVRKDGQTEIIGGALYAQFGLRSNSNTATITLGSSDDVILSRDAADTLAQRRSTNAQTFRVYNTFTDASNYERLGITWSSNNLEIYTASAGTGTARDLRVGTGGAAELYLTTNNTRRWYLGGSTGHFLAVADNTYDIGASGANRPRNVYLAGFADIRGSVYVGSFIEIIGSSAGVGLIRQFATQDFNRLQFGGTTSSFPALKRSTTALEVRLADDSAYAPLLCSSFSASSSITTSADIQVRSGTAIPAGGTAGVGVKLSSTSNFGVFFGSGAPTLSAAKGSLYLRSDGSTTNDRLYVNTDGSTTWTAVTTAA
jgi:hypothetical protein